MQNASVVEVTSGRSWAGMLYAGPRGPVTQVVLEPLGSRCFWDGGVFYRGGRGVGTGHTAPLHVWWVSERVGFWIMHMPVHAHVCTSTAALCLPAVSGNLLPAFALNRPGKGDLGLDVCCVLGVGGEGMRRARGRKGTAVTEGTPQSAYAPPFRLTSSGWT